MTLYKRGEDISARMFKCFRDGLCFVHRAPTLRWWAINEKPFAYIEYFAVPANDDLNLSFKYF